VAAAMMFEGTEPDRVKFAWLVNEETRPFFDNELILFPLEIIKFKMK
jgi:hypothetical protein